MSKARQANSAYPEQTGKNDNLLRRLSARTYWTSAPERIVVAIYAFALVFPLLLIVIAHVPGVDLSYFLPYPYSTYAILLPLSITYFPVLTLPFALELIWSSFPDLLLFSNVVSPLLILFYPLVSYYLWRRNQIAWALSFISSVATIVLETYSASISPYGAFWVFGIAVNFAILYLLWRCRSKFFNPWD